MGPCVDGAWCGDRTPSARPARRAEPVEVHSTASSWPPLRKRLLKQRSKPLVCLYKVVRTLGKELAAEVVCILPVRESLLEKTKTRDEGRTRIARRKIAIKNSIGCQSAHRFQQATLESLTILACKWPAQDQAAFAPVVVVVRHRHDQALKRYCCVREPILDCSRTVPISKHYAPGGSATRLLLAGRRLAIGCRHLVVRNVLGEHVEK